jgi:GMP synthase-like glutamine amidotransferase
MLNIHYFQHVPFEGLGVIEKWVAKERCHLSATHFYESHSLPELDSIDWLIIMGGPMGVYDEAIFPWLIPEKEFVKKAIDAGKVVIGICLGAQLIASALGAPVYPNKEREIGWFPVQLTEAAKKNLFFSFMPTELSVFHWHGDTFDLPVGAELMAESSACKNQAFVSNDKVIGLQFHFEVDEHAIRGMVDGADAELQPGPYVQTATDIIRQAELSKQNNILMFAILDKIKATFQ